MASRVNTDLQTLLWTLKTRPLELFEVAEIFGIGRRYVSGFVRRIEGVDRIGRRVRIPLAQCPVEYLLGVGLLNSANLGESLQQLRLIPARDGESVSLQDKGGPCNVATDNPDNSSKSVESLTIRDSGTDTA